MRIFCDIGNRLSSYSEVCFDEEERTHNYNGRTHLCCDHRVINHQNQRFACYLINGQWRLVDNYKERVCKGSVYSTENTEMQCSESGPYNSTTSIDCGGVIHPRVNGDACCGTSIMNSSTEVCCRNSSGKAVPLTPEQCCASTTLEARGLPCCAGSLYNPKEKMCCHEGLFNKTGSRQCSQDPKCPVYDTLTHLEVKASINGPCTVVEIVNGKTSVCGGELFNPNNSVCDRNRRVIRIDSKSGSMCGSVPYNKENATCCEGTITEGMPEIEGLVQCNGSIPVLTSDHLICMGMVYPRSDIIDEACCATDVYRTDSQICCEGNIYNKSSPSTDCCGKSIFDRTSQLCYSGYYPYINIVVNGTTDESKVCAGKLLERNESCRRDTFYEKVVKTWEDVDAFCGVFGYKRDKYFCDRNQSLVPHEPYESLCILPYEDRLFDTREFICCGGKILPNLTPCGKKRECCNDWPFVPEFQTCSQGNGIWNVPRHFASICGSKIFNNQTHVCDSNNYVVVEKGELERKPSVCWDKNGTPVRYNELEHFCCDRQLWSNVGYEDPDCCNNVPYDRASPNHVCCQGSLLSTGGIPMTCEGRVAYSNDQQVCGGFIYNKSDGSCCGSGVYDPERELCCGDTVKIPKSSETERCCGLAKFDEADASLVCCDNSTLHTKVPGYQCCGSSLMNPEKSICLNDEYMIGREYEDKTCNASNLEHERGTCCAGILHVGKFGSCDGLHFVGRADDQLWCGQGVLKHGEACCDGIPYDQESYTCVNNSMIMPTCNGTLFDKSTESCCSQVIISNSENICCSGWIRNVSNEEDRCCDGIAYNSRTSICCRNEVKDLRDPNTDPNKCCDENESFKMATGNCEPVPPTEIAPGCPVCPDYERSKSEVATAAVNSSYQVMVKITRTYTTGGVSVRIGDLPRQCEKCRQDLEDQPSQIKRMVFPEGCTCSFILNSKYILLAYSPIVRGDELILSEGAVILPRNLLNRVIRSIDGRTS